MNESEQKPVTSEAYGAIADIIDRFELVREMKTINALLAAYQAGVDYMYNAGIKEV